jgi:hypothetical protein
MLNASFNMEANSDQRERIVYHLTKMGYGRLIEEDPSLITRIQEKLSLMRTDVFIDEKRDNFILPKERAELPSKLSMSHPAYYRSLLLNNVMVPYIENAPRMIQNILVTQLCITAATIHTQTIPYIQPIDQHSFPISNKDSGEKLDIIAKKDHVSHPKVMMIHSHQQTKVALRYQQYVKEWSKYNYLRTERANRKTLVSEIDKCKSIQ